jgi:hypothetical protein
MLHPHAVLELHNYLSDFEPARVECIRNPRDPRIPGLLHEFRVAQEYSVSAGWRSAVLFMRFVGAPGA